MVVKKKGKALGFLPETPDKKETFKESTGRLISWSPWPPANFKTRYPAFPLATTILLLIILRGLSLI